MKLRLFAKTALPTIILAGAVTTAFAAGPPIGISPVDTGSLPSTGEEWLTVNPYRADTAGVDVWKEAVEVGASGYNQNCARCHGIEGVSGGLAPDLRYLEAEEYGDEWYAERFRSGMTQNGAWAIRTYIETRPDSDAMDAVSDELKALRDQMAEYANNAEGADAEALQARLTEIGEGIDTLSGAPVADSIALRAAAQIDGTPAAYETAAETLTIGLSAAN